MSDASDEAAENNARRDEARREREDAETVRRLLSHKSGRAWFYRLLKRSNIYGTSFVPGQPDTTAFELGREDVGRRLMAQAMEACEDLYLLMIREVRQEEERAAAEEAEREKKEAADYGAAIRTQGHDLPPPEGWPGHVPPKKPE
jgi:hypothetical protein